MGEPNEDALLLHAHLASRDDTGVNGVRVGGSELNLWRGTADKHVCLLRLQGSMEPNGARKLGVFVKAAVKCSYGLL